MKGEFYKMDYEAWDEGTIELSLEQEAAYLRLCHQMYRRRGPIPNSKRLLCVIFRCGHTKASAPLNAFVEAGKISITEDGYLSNGRVLRELEDRRDLAAKRQAAGEKGGARRRPGADQTPSKSRPSADQVPTNLGADPEQVPTNLGATPPKPLKNHDPPEANASTASKQRREEEEKRRAQHSATGNGDGGLAALRQRIVKIFEARNRMCPDTAYASVWLAQGYSPDLIAAVVDEGLSRNGDVHRLKYFDAALREAHEKRPAAAPPQASTGASPIDPEKLRHAQKILLRMYYRNGELWSDGWNDIYGGPPGTERCKIPDDVIEEVRREPGLLSHGGGLAAAAQ